MYVDDSVSRVAKKQRARVGQGLATDGGWERREEERKRKRKRRKGFSPRNAPDRLDWTGSAAVGIESNYPGM